MSLKRFIRLNQSNKVICVRWGQEIVAGEIESELGECGQIMQPDGTFIDEPAPPTPQMTDLEAKINYIYLKQKGLI